jgi:hypothetical protein
VEPLGSQIEVTPVGLTGPDSGEGELAPPKPMSAMKARDLLLTNVLCGEERPNLDEPQPAVPLREIPADAKAVAGLTVAELRIALRERGLSPAGARATLVERLLTGLQGGVEPLLVTAHEHSSGVGSGALSAAYARADGQVDGPPVVRGAGAPPPSGELQALLEGDDTFGPPPAAPPPMSEGARANLASHIQILGDEPSAADADAEAGRRADPRRVADLQGQGIFTAAAPESAPWSALKAKDYKGSGIFDEAAPGPTRLEGSTARPLPGKRVELGSHIAFQAGFTVGDGEVPAPGLGLSTAKSTELTGNDFISLPAAPLPQPAPWSAYKSAELDSTVFSQPQDGEGGGSGSATKASPPQSAARAREYASTLFTEGFTGPQPVKQPTATLVKHVEDIHSKNSAEGCTMAFAQPSPPAAGAQQPRRSSGGGVSSIVFG